MSSQHLTPVEVAEIAHPCDYCGAEPNAWCTTRSGEPATYLHADRWWHWKIADEVARFDRREREALNREGKR